MSTSAHTASQETRRICALAPVIPVLVIEDWALAAPLATALIAGGLPVLEVTLRTDAALKAISEMAKVPGGIVGAGTLLTPKDVANARRAGAQFGVSPGATDDLLQACEDENLPLLPGAASASEVMRLQARGYDMLKFFPASAIGGAPALAALSGPLADVRFCPTGGVSAGNAKDYLSLPNVVCVGGSWVAPRALVANRQWDKIEDLARAASQLAR